MRFEDWLKKFSALHERARAGKLTAVESRTYLGARNELARALMKQQQRALPHGARGRQLLRAPTAVPVDMTLPGGKVHALTTELWSGGFSALIPPLGMATERLHFALVVGKDSPPIEGWGRVTADHAAAGSTRLTVEFESITPAETERIEFAVFDAVLARLTPPGAPPAA